MDSFLGNLLVCVEMMKDEIEEENENENENENDVVHR